MAKIIKKSNKKTSWFKKITHAAKNNKRESIVVLLFISILATLLSIGAYTQYISQVDERNVIKMHSNTTDIKASFDSSDGKIEWKDGSHCTVIDPRLFGEETQYSCTSTYKTSRVVAGQDDINSTIDLYQRVLQSNAGTHLNNTKSIKYPVYTEDIAYLTKPDYQKPMQTSIYGFTLNAVKPAKCHTNYELRSDTARAGVEMVVELSCFIDTKKAYFEPIERI